MPMRTRANACFVPLTLKRRTTALDKTSGLASPRANYPHLFRGHIRKRAARTSSSQHRQAAVVVAAASSIDAAVNAALTPAYPVAQPAMIFLVSRTIGPIDNYRRHFYIHDVLSSMSCTVNLHDPSQDADPRVFVREVNDEYFSVINDNSSELNRFSKFVQTIL